RIYRTSVPGFAAVRAPDRLDFCSCKRTPIFRAEVCYAWIGEGSGGVDLPRVRAGSGPREAGAALTGMVTDASGAVLPGVAVEARSPSLIEQVRSAVTDEGGRYRIVDLR